MGRNPVNNNSKAFTPHHFFAKSGEGFTLIEVVVGTALLLIVFMGIFSVYRLGMKVVFQSKARIIGVSLANQKIEEVRNLSYGNVGTFNCPEEHLGCEYGDEWAIPNTPAGPIKKEQTATLNNVNYTILTDIDYITNCSDGIGDGTVETCPVGAEGSCAETPCPPDNCSNDYKKAKVIISWKNPYIGQISLESMISPKTKEQECIEAGGFLVIKVRDSLSQKFSSPQIDVENLFTYQTESESPESGEILFVLDPGMGIYKINVSNGAGYSSISTYGIGDEHNGHIIAFQIPELSHASVIENDFWEESYYIDKVSSFFVETFSHAEPENFFDPLDNEDNISEKSQINISGGQAELDINSGPYYESGYIISNAITPDNLVLWEDIIFSDQQPHLTEIRYSILYNAGADWQIIPDSDLPGNEIGFEYSPINLFDLDTLIYPSIKIKARFLTTDTSITPVLEDWEIIWSTTDSIPIANVDFDIHSKKIVGKDSGNFDIYKYDESSITNSVGQTTLPNLEWDEYYFSGFSISGAVLDLAKSIPELSGENSIYLPADINKNIKFFLETPYSLLIEVNNSETGEDITDADVHLYNVGLGYDKNQPTNPNGSVIFLYLENNTYQLEITADGYDPFLVEPILISGQEVKTVELTPTPIP